MTDQIKTVLTIEDLMDMDDRWFEHIEDFIEASTEAVWVVYPSRGEVCLYHRVNPDMVRIFRADDSLKSNVLPDLTLKVSAIIKI